MRPPVLESGLALTPAGVACCHAPPVVVPRGPARWGVLGARAAAAATVLVVLVSCVVAYVLDARLASLGRRDLRQGDGAAPVFWLAAFADGTVGAALLLHDRRHPVGWCFCGLALAIASAGVLQSYGVYALLAHRPSLPGGGSAATVSSYLFIVWLVLLGLVCSLTPTGRHLSRRWRRADLVMVGAGLVWLTATLLSPELLKDPFQSVANGWGVSAVRTPVTAVAPVAAGMANVLVLVAAASLLVRFRRSSGDERRRLLWMAVVAVPFPFLVVAAFVASWSGQVALLDVAAAGFVVLLPVGAALAISRYHLFDVERLLSRALSWAIVSTLLAGAFTVVVVLTARVAGQAVGSSPVAVALATLAAAATARPLHTAVQDVLDRKFSRRRHEALRRVRDFVAAPTVGVSVQDVLRAALDDPGLSVAYWVTDGEQWVSEQGLPNVPGARALVLDRAGVRVAAVTGSGDEQLTREAADTASAELANTGLRAAVALQLEQVRASRARIAAAQLQERRRVERDLHDGAQQRLLGLAAHLQAGLLNGSPDAMRAALRLGVDESRAAVAELRALANGLHPAVLQDGGLTAALEDLALRLPVRLEVGQPDRRYAEQVESTAWFVVCEAVSNALKHAGASTVTVCLDEQDSQLNVVVADDGRGGADAGGSGLGGLADRAEAAGGRLLVLPGQRRGTRIEVSLPCGS